MQQHQDSRCPRLLVIRFSALGDVAMTLPVIYSLARQYPHLKVTLLTTPFFARLFINVPENLEVVAVDLKKDYRGVRGLFRLLRLVAGMRFDFVADLHNVLRSWLIDCLMGLKGCRVRMVNKGRGERVCLLYGRRKAVARNYVMRYGDTFAALGFPVKLSFKSLFDKAEKIAPFDVPEKAVGIAPFARYANKTYPFEQTKEVVRLLSRHGFPVFLFGGGEKERALLEKLEAAFPNVRSLAGIFSIEDELRIMSCLRVMLSMDSANQHLASLVGVPVVSVWGSTTPACGFMAYGQSEENALCLNLDCQPCTIAGSKTCRKGHFGCMHNLSPEVAVERVMKIQGNH